VPEQGGGSGHAAMKPGFLKWWNGVRYGLGRVTVAPYKYGGLVALHTVLEFKFNIEVCAF